MLTTPAFGAIHVITTIPNVNLSTAATRIVRRGFRTPQKVKEQPVKPVQPIVEITRTPGRSLGPKDMALAQKTLEVKSRGDRTTQRTHNIYVPESGIRAFFWRRLGRLIPNLALLGYATKPLTPQEVLDAMASKGKKG